MARTIFSRIIDGEIAADRVYEDDAVLVIRDITPMAPFHLLILPKKPIENIDAATEEDTQLLGQMLLRAAKVARDLGVAESGYRLVFNVNENGGQTVPHLHLHLLGGRRLSWPPG